MVLFSSNNVYASQKLGLGEISIVSINGRLILQLNHLFLGAGDRKANVVFRGCNNSSITISIQSKVYTDIELHNCNLSSNEKLFVDLFYGPVKPENYQGRYFFNDTPLVQHNLVGQFRNYFSANLGPKKEDREGVLTIHVKEASGDIFIDNINYSLIRGSRLHYRRWLTDGSYVKQAMINGIEVDVDIEGVDLTNRK